MGVKGDFAKLRKLTKALGVMASPELLVRMNWQLAEEALSLSQQCFTKKRAPSGEPWPQLRSRAGRPLWNAGILFASVHRVIQPRGFTVETNHPHAAIHNSGGTIHVRNAKALRFMVRGKPVFAQHVVIPQRQFLPRSGTIPIQWRLALQATAKAFVQHVVKTANAEARAARKAAR
jgi:phage gpG-like protein